MKLIIRKKKSRSTKKVSKPKRKVKSSKKRSNSNNMAKKKKSSGKRRKSQGRNMLSKIPVIGDIANNPTVKKAAAGVGTATVITGVAALVPNPTVQAMAQNPLVRIALAGGAGGAEGAVAQLVTSGGLNLGGGSNGMADMGGMA